ncbi:MAG: hypothetical protein AUG06_01645 [Actinobacteria bacterium 13_1_20CM_2_65_11]|nr:MAG: hypothetical protein AUH40_12730 [Chloroflexi bacterium 13_1_40CM_65_17]OLE81331.1 MAG: hypothetical protein AUG06_01645 [Actinobacteria bacterium 13_1_20CM_2_65_11]
MAAFFLAAGFLAAFFFAAMMVHLLHSISDPMTFLFWRVQMHSSKRSAAYRVVASVMATLSSIAFRPL